jgi:hypothetical protein
MTEQLPEPLGRPRRAEYTPVDFQHFRDSQSLEITPKFQRRPVWQTPQRSYFIDTLIRGLPVPPIFLRETQSEDFTHFVRQVIDGQQRLRAVLDFIDDRYSISKAVSAPWAGRRFSDLSHAAQNRITNYHFSCEVFSDIPDEAVLNIFARMNTYSVQLNRQELRNGRWFGHFKQSSLQLAHEHLPFWRAHRLFTEQAIARMQEVELTSELLIVQMAGVQDKKNTIDSFYAEYDESFTQEGKVSAEFRHVIDQLGLAFPETLAQTNFHRVPLYYSLHAAVHHRLFSVPGLTLPRRTGRNLTADERARLVDAVNSLSDYVDDARDERPVPRKYAAFVAACLRQTDNLQPRLRRLTTVYSEAQLG